MRIHHRLSCGASALILALTGVCAAHAAPAAADWSGFYVGAAAGGTFTDNHFGLPGDHSDVLQQTRNGSTAFTGGGLIGFNHQMGSLVAGVEGDYVGGDSTANVTACNVSDGCFTPTHDSFTTFNRLREGDTGRVRVRLGVANGANLFYAAVGYSTTQTKLNLVGDCFNGANPTVPLIFTFSRSKTLSGFNIGAGVERQITSHWIARAEYIHDDFGNQTYRGDGSEWNDRRIAVNYNTVRAAISYRF
jgi:outer membrane immunogenic protein